MRTIALLSVLGLFSLPAAPALAGRFDRIEDAAEEYRDSVKDLRREVDRARHMSGHFHDLIHELERAVEALEQFSDDDDPMHQMLREYDRVVELHHHVAHDAPAVAPLLGRDGHRDLEAVYRDFDRLVREVERVAHPPAHVYRPPLYERPRNAPPVYGPPASYGPPSYGARPYETPAYPSPRYERGPGYERGPEYERGRGYERVEPLPPPVSVPAPRGEVEIRLRSSDRYPEYRRPTSLRSQLVNSVLAEIFD